MGGEHDKLKLGKGVLFVKSQIRRLVQESDTWEADFMAVPKPVMQTATHYLGLVVTHPDGIRLASQPVEQAPTVNDLANLLAKAMRRPLIEGPHRPRCILLRRNPRWKQLFPPLKELEIEVVIQNELPNVTAAFEEYLSRLKDARSAGRIKPTVEQAKVERMFPAIAPGNIFADLPAHLPDELLTTLLDAADVRIERIVSLGHASPEGFWYDQTENEFVLVVQGAARLRVEDEVIEMMPGNWINISAHRKHRVEWTTPDEPTIWLAVHYGDQR